MAVKYEIECVGRSILGGTPLALGTAAIEMLVTMSMNKWAKLKEHWLDNGCSVPTAVTEVQILAFEKTYRLRMPSDLRNYFLTMDGSGESLGSDMFSFWPLSTMEPLSDYLTEGIYTDRLDYPNCFIFADWCVNSHMYLIELSATSLRNPVSIYAGNGRNPPISQAFDDFIDLYLENWETVLP